MSAMDTTVADAEAAIVGLALHGHTEIDEAHLIGDDFQSPKLGALWDLTARLRHQGEPADPATIVAHLPRLEVRGIEPEDISSLYGNAPVGAVEHYARLVADAATRRRLRVVGTRIVQLADATETAGEAVELARGEVDACSTSIAGLHMIEDNLGETIRRLDQPTVAIPTPWREMNYLIGGLRPGGLYIIGARPGVGKSLMANGLALGLARHGGVAYNNLEMSRHEVFERMLAAVSSVRYGKFVDRTLQAEDYRRIEAHVDGLSGLPISLDDRSTVTVTDIRSHARTLARRGPLAGIVVDYLQLMGSGAVKGDRRARHEIVGEISRSLKILAKELNVPVIALSQLKRPDSSRADKNPTMSDLRESGSLEQDADVVLLLHVDEETDPTKMLVAAAKNRQGRTGWFPLGRQGEYARLVDAKWTPAGTA
jgi:replicative DNA helicase